MALYWILLVLSAAIGIPLCGLTDDKKSIRAFVYCIAAGAALTVISSIRLGVGYDYNLYASWYYGLNFKDFDDVGLMKQEKGLMYLLKLLNIIFVDYPPAFVLISLLIYPPLTVYIYKYSDNRWLSVFAFLGMGLFFNSMNFMRQFIAAVICAFAFRYAEKGSPWRFAVLTVFAVSFHRSALIILPCYLFCFIGWNMITLGAAAVFSAAMLLLSEPILRFTTHFVYSGYDVDTNADMKGLSPRYTVIYGILFAAAFLLRDRMKGEKRSINIIIWCCFFSFFFELMGIRYGIISRFALLFFIPAVCLGVPKAVSALSELKESKITRALASGAAIAALSLCYGLLLYHNYNGVVPYDVVFSELNI